MLVAPEGETVKQTRCCEFCLPAFARETARDMGFHRECRVFPFTSQVEQAAQFETEALRQIGLLDVQIPPRYSTSYFNHVFGGGYAAGGTGRSGTLGRDIRRRHEDYTGG